MTDQRKQEQKDFESYNKLKFTDWKDRKVTYNERQSQTEQTTEKADNRTEEQKAFDDYLQTRAVAKTQAVEVHMTRTTRVGDPQTYVNLFNGTKTGTVYYEAKDKDDYREPLIENTLKSGYQTLLRTVITDKDKFGMLTQTVEAPEYLGNDVHIFTRTGIVSQNKWTPWKQVTSGGGGDVVVPTFEQQCVATASSVESTEQPSVTVTLKQHPEHQEGTDHKQFNFDFKIPKGADGASGGGGGGQQPQEPIIPKDKVLKTVTGKYAVNLFNYREMSRDWRFGVRGKTFTTKGHEQRIFPDVSRSEDLSIQKAKLRDIKTLTPYNRIRTGESFWYDAKKFHAPHHEEGQQEIHAFIHSFNKDDIKTSLEINPTYSHPHEPDEATNFKNAGFGYLRFDIGGSQTPAKGEIELEAWYGTDNKFRPDNDRQDFTFLEYNGVELKANHKGVKDEYKHTRWADFVDIKLNVLDLKDAELLKTTDTPDANTTMLFVKCPSDLWYPVDGHEGVTEHTVEGKLKIMRDNLMTNNLCDITGDDATGAEEDKPFFVKDITEVAKLLPNGETARYKCFQILIGRENKSKWREHLSQTQIMYLVQDTEKEPLQVKWIQLPRGGMIYTLNSGQTIETNKYGHLENFNVKGHKTRGIKFSKSPFGYPDIVIDSDSIASVVLTPFNDDFQS